MQPVLHIARLGHSAVTAMPVSALTTAKPGKLDARVTQPRLLGLQLGGRLFVPTVNDSLCPIGRADKVEGNKSAHLNTPVRVIDHRPTVTSVALVRAYGSELTPGDNGWQQTGPNTHEFG